MSNVMPINKEGLVRVVVSVSIPAGVVGGSEGGKIAISMSKLNREKCGIELYEGDDVEEPIHMSSKRFVHEDKVWVFRVVDGKHNAATKIAYPKDALRYQVSTNGVLFETLRPTTCEASYDKEKRELRIDRSLIPPLKMRGRRNPPRRAGVVLPEQETIEVPKRKVSLSNPADAIAYLRRSIAHAVEGWCRILDSLEAELDSREA